GIVCWRHDQFARLGQILRSAGVLDRVPAGRERDGLAVGTIDLGVEEEIGREPLGLRWIDPALGIANEQAAGRGRAIIVKDVKAHLAAGLTFEQNGDLAAKAQILRALADVEAERSLALSGATAAKLQETVFEAESR